MTRPAKHCLLVVDDEEDLVHSVKDLLRYDYRVLGATRAAEGLEIMDREEVQIVMSDQCMPEMTGVEFLSKLRERYPDTVRLLFTAYADIKAVINAINQGSVYRYITKPWEPEDLQTVLKQASDHFELLRERQRLLLQLQDKNKELESANTELGQANDMKTAFIKVASHELRTPLTIVMGLSELAAMTPGVPPPIDDWVGRIHAGSKRLADRVDQMIKLLLADQFDRPLDRSDVIIGEVFKSAEVDVKSFIKQRNQTLQVEPPGDDCTVFAEAEKIRDCVLQLLVNAIKFTSDGGEIRLSAEKLSDGNIAIRVSDTGMGMDDAHVARVFEPFFTRFDVAKHSSGVYEYDRRGLGLGLSVVKAFVELHGGKVEVASEVGKGSTFTIILPASGHQGGNGPA